MNLEKLFHLKENHTDVRTEVMAGITTFMTMAYILAVNPSILSASGMDSGAVFTATALASAIATLLMAALSNYPFVLAPGMESLSTSEYENLNFDVHSSIWTAADNMRLYKMLANLWNGPSIGFTSPKLEHYIKSTQEHIDILTAIRNHDAKKARKEMEQHTERSMNNILKSFKFR